MAKIIGNLTYTVYLCHFLLCENCLPEELNIELVII